jgi:hypothetical protein
MAIVLSSQLATAHVSLMWPPSRFQNPSGGEPPHNSVLPRERSISYRSAERMPNACTQCPGPRRASSRRYWRAPVGATTLRASGSVRAASPAVRRAPTASSRRCFPRTCTTLAASRVQRWRQPSTSVCVRTPTRPPATGRAGTRGVHPAPRPWLARAASRAAAALRGAG